MRSLRTHPYVLLRKNKQTERLRETMGFFIKNSTIYSAKTKDYKMA